MQTRRILRFALAMPVALALVAVPLIAQSQQQREVPPPPDLSEERMEVMAKAFLDVSALQQALEQRLESAATPDEARKLQAEANDEILATLEDREVTVEEYAEAMNATQSHRSFRERFLAALERVQEEGPDEE